MAFDPNKIEVVGTREAANALRNASGKDSLTTDEAERVKLLAELKKADFEKRKSREMREPSEDESKLFNEISKVISIGDPLSTRMETFLTSQLDTVQGFRLAAMTRQVLLDIVTRSVRRKTALGHVNQECLSRLANLSLYSGSSSGDLNIGPIAELITEASGSDYDIEDLYKKLTDGLKILKSPPGIDLTTIESLNSLSPTATTELIEMNEVIDIHKIRSIINFKNAIEEFLTRP